MIFLEIRKNIPLVSVKSKNIIKYVEKFSLRVIRKKNKKDEVKYTEAGLCDSASSIIHHPSFSESQWEAFFLAKNRKKGYQIPKVYVPWDSEQIWKIVDKSHA